MTNINYTTMFTQTIKTANNSCLYDNNFSGGEQTETLPGGGFHGGEQTETLPGGGFHGGEQTETLPGGGFHGGEQTETLPGGGFHEDKQMTLSGGCDNIDKLDERMIIEDSS